jgi:type IV pilus assembly protein PilB
MSTEQITGATSTPPIVHPSFDEMALDDIRIGVNSIEAEPGAHSEEELARELAKSLRLTFVQLASISFDPKAVARIPEALARKHKCIAYAQGTNPHRKTISIAMANPGNMLAQQELSFVAGSMITATVATGTDIEQAIEREYCTEKWDSDFDELVDEGHMRILADEEEATESEKKNLNDTPVVKLLNLIIQQGIREAASDIHLEPNVNHLQVRGRVRGILREFIHVPKWLHEPVISRLKILAKLDITDRRRPQDGRIKVFYEGRDIDLRVSTLPTHHGEKAVLRILGCGQQIPSLSELGIPEAEIKVLKRSTDQPQGMILVTGPTGSGKTTTLYSVIHEKRDSSINIVTVEDPIEFQIDGITQVQVNTKAGLTFAASLRSILRQDPDVILVGEIRDLETAEIAVHAAQTGHLVLTTLHTNNTVATITRLLDLGLDPYLASTSFTLIVAQRLIRELCSHCKQQYTPTTAELERVRLKGFTGPLYRSQGCSKCENTGYQGRSGIYEVLRITNPIRELIARHSNEPELRKAALATGMVPLLDSAVKKFRDGITSYDEVVRVVQFEEEETASFCPACQAAVEPSFSMCPYCLCALRLNCSSCSTELKAGWKICPHCGTSVAGAASASAIQEEFEETKSPAESHSLLAKRRTPFHILIVDDDPVVLDLIRNSLSLLDVKVEVREARQGIAALQIAREWKPDLMITDVEMPKLNGFELCKMLRKEASTALMPILMLTVTQDESARTKGFLFGTDDYMGKPFSFSELNARVSRLLHRTHGV